MIRISNIKIKPEGGDEAAISQALRRLNLSADQARARIARKSVDARDKGDIRLIYSVDVYAPGDEAALLERLKPKDAQLLPEPERLLIPAARSQTRPVVVGLGPCGLFAALYLARAGLKPLVLERGQDTDNRLRAVSRFFSAAELNPDSNIQFGEGGAGAFSDGKLTTGIKDPLCREVLHTLHDFGAPEAILYLARPHVGTDKLPRVVKAIRQEVERLGGEVRFEARLTGIEVDGGRLRGVRYRQAGQAHEVKTDQLILALGHSARDTQQALHLQGLHMERKPFSIGVRLEQQQSLIDGAQYGPSAGRPGLPAAEYHLAMRTSTGRGAYTFCMCPGGQVVNASSERGHLCVNGMSPYARNGRNANAAILVDVRPEDFPGDDVLSGFAFQRHWEAHAFRLGGGQWRAPAQLAQDFLHGKASIALQDVQPTVKPGITLSDLSLCLPDFAVQGLREALPAFERKLKGYLSGGALLTGIETRSSSPVRTPRDSSYQANIRGLYPAGEGAGMAGGIMSAAVDGLRAARALCASLTP